jgi:toxin ParE1/3/4
MPQYEILYLKTAETDLYEIFDYVNQDDPGAALSLYQRIEDSISSLAQNPELGTVPGDDRLKNMGYRMLVVGKYLVFYIIKEKVIQIRRIIHGARKYSFLL